MLGNVWGYDTETVKKWGGGWPFTLQLTHDKTHLFHIQKNLNACMFRNVFLKTVERYCEDGDALFSYNLFFENQVIFRDKIWLFRDNRVSIKIGNCHITGILEDPTPFLRLEYPKKVVWVLDAAKFVQGDHGGTLEEVAKTFLPIRKMPRPRYLGQRKPTNKEMSYFKRYAMMDSILTETLGREVIKKYHEKAGLDTWCFSVAHLAGKFFNKKFTNGKKLDLAPPKVEGGAVWARFGGYRRGWVGPGVYRDYVHLDLKSAYPWAYSRMRAYFGGRYVVSRKVPKDGEGVYKIETILPKQDIRPLFQKRGKHGEILTQPLNQLIRFWVTGAEINAYKRVWPEWKYKILIGYEWKGQSKNRPLNRWAKFAFGIKNSAPNKSDYRYHFGKGLANHITGKFDSSIKRSEETWLTPEGPMTFQETTPGSLRNYMVAAIIRGIVRAKVWGDSRYWEKFPVNPSIQEMTDSIDVPRSELHRFKIGDRLGQWGIDAEGDLVFLRTGTYIYWGRGKSKKVAYHGIQMRNKRTGKFDVKMFFRFLKKGGGTYTRKRMIRAREALKRDGIAGTSCLLFHDKEFKFKVSKSFKEEFVKWLKEKKVRL